MTDQERLARRIRLLQAVGWKWHKDSYANRNSFYLSNRDLDAEWWKPCKCPSMPDDVEYFNSAMSHAPDVDGETAEGALIRETIRLHLTHQGIHVDFAPPVNGVYRVTVEGDPFNDLPLPYLTKCAESPIEAFLCAADNALTALDQDKA